MIDDNEPSKLGETIQGIGVMGVAASFIGYAIIALACVIESVRDRPMPAGPAAMVMCLMLISIGIVIVGRVVQHLHEARR